MVEGSSTKVSPAAQTERDRIDLAKKCAYKHWPSSGHTCFFCCDNTCCNWDPGFDFDFESTFAQVSQMTDWTTGFETAEANTDGRLTYDQGIQLLKSYRSIGGQMRKAQVLRLTGEAFDVIAAMCSCIAPILVGLSTQYDKATEPFEYMLLTVISIVLSVLAATCVAFETTRKFKLEGFKTLLSCHESWYHMSRFMGRAQPYGGPPRKAFRLLVNDLEQARWRSAQEIIMALSSKPQSAPNECKPEEEPEAEAPPAPAGKSADA